MKENIFDSFNAPTASERKQVLTSEIGRDNLQKLVEHELSEGFAMPAFLTAEDIKEISNFCRKTHRLLSEAGRSVSNMAYLPSEALSSDPKTLLPTFEGADGIELSESFLSVDSFHDLLQLLPPACNTVRVQANHFKKVCEAVEESGRPFLIYVTDISEGFIAENSASVESGKHKLLGIELPTDFFSESLAEEIAALLVKVGRTVDVCTKHGIAANQIVRNLHIKTTIGNRFLAEIAKLRALRFMTTEFLLKTFPALSELPHLHIHAVTTPQPRVGKDVYTNILSNTVQTTAAVCGGADSITVLPHDFLSEEKSTFSGRIAKNTLSLLNEEGRMLQTQDPASGAYYLEVFSYKMAQKAWGLYTDSAR